MDTTDSKKEVTTDHENDTKIVEGDHSDLIHYEDGKIQKKVYGGD